MKDQLIITLRELRTIHEMLKAESSEMDSNTFEEALRVLTLRSEIDVVEAAIRELNKKLLPMLVINK